MNKKIQNENNVCVINSLRYGVGGRGVAEPKGSDDAFTDEQPKKEDILKGKGESIPLLDTLNSYGE